MFSHKKTKTILTPELKDDFIKFQELFNNSSKSVDVLVEEIGNVDSCIVNYAKTCKNGSLTMDGFKKSLEENTLSAKAGKLALQGLATVGNMFVSWAITKGIELFVNWVDESIVTTEEYKEKLNELKAECSAIESDLSSLNDELSTTNERMRELEGKDVLTFTEKEEYNNLVKQNNELERKIALLEYEQKVKNREKNKAFVDTMNSDVETGEWGYVKDDQTGKISKGNASLYSVVGGMSGSTATYSMATEQEFINQQFEERIRLTEQLNSMEIVTPNTSEERAEQIEEETNTLKSQIEDIDKYLQDKSLEWSTNASEISYISNPSTDDEKAVNAWLDFIADFQDKMLIMTSEGNASANAENKQNTFNRLIDNWQFDETVQGLQDLGEQGQVTADMLTDPKYDEFIAKLAELGVIDSTDNLEDIALAFNKVAEATGSINPDEMNIQWSFSETITQLDTAKEKLATLDETYAKLFDGDKKTNIGFDDFSAINEAFSDVTNIDNYIQRLQEAGQDTEQVTLVMEDLIGAYLEQSKVLDNVTDENKDLITSMLREMGIVNAEELVLAHLTHQTEMVTIQKQFATEKGYEFANATIAEATELINEANCSELTKQALAQLALEKINVNKQKIDTSSDIDNVISLANAALASESALIKLQKAKSVLGVVESVGSWQSAGISKKDYEEALNIVQQIENGTFDYDFQTLDADKYKAGYTPKYSPQTVAGTKTYDALEKSADSAKKEFKEVVDFFEERIKKLDNAISLLDANLENVVGSFAKNKLISAQIDINAEKINNYSSAIEMYSQKASEALSSIPENLRDKVINGAISLDTFVGENGEQVTEAIEEYNKWAEKISECNQQLTELQQTLEDLELQKFTNIIDDFSSQFNIYENSKSLIDKQIDLFKEAGELIGSSFYDVQIDQSQKQLALLQEEKKQLVEQMNSALASGRVKTGSEAWISMLDSLQEVESSILDVKTEIESLDNSLKELHFENLERVADRFSEISKEINNLIGLIDDADVSDNNGNFSPEGLTQLGLYAQEYERAIYTSQMYGEEIEKLNQAYINGEYSVLEYQEKLASLTESQWDAINTAESVKDSILALHEARVDKAVEGIEKEKDAYRELIDEQLKTIENEEKLRNYKSDIEEATKKVTDIERQIAALSLDNSASANAKKKQLQEDLLNARKELEELQYQHSVEMQKEALETEYENFESEKDAEIEELEKSLDDKEQLIADSFETVKQNSNIIGQEIANIANKHGVTISNAIVSSWQSGENAIASYGATLDVYSSAFIGQLMGVENEVYNLQAQANNTANSLVGMFSTRADNLVNELISSYNSIGNVNAMTNALKNSLVNTLESGYNVSGITSALNSITSAANAAKSAIDNLNNTSVNTQTEQPKTGYTMNQNAQTGYYEIIERASGKVVSTHRTEKAAMNAYSKLPQYASGTRNAKGGLIIKDEEGFELQLDKLINGNYTIASDGAQILTKPQTDNIFDWAKLNPNQFLNVQPNYTLPKMPEIVQRNTSAPTLSIGNLVTVNGNIDDTNVARMEKVANKAVTDAFNRFTKQVNYGGF